MESSESAVSPRRTVIEVNGTGQGTNRRRRRRNRKKDKFVPQRVPVSEVYKELGDPSTWEEDRRRYEEKIRQRPEVTNTIPLEVGPVIAAALEYGKKTHALGALRATRALKHVVSILTSLNEPGKELVSLSQYVTDELNEIQGMLNRAYNADEDQVDSYAT